ncbi:hypothetical protein FOI68_04540 [Brevibacillus sp. LEMMJ03]|uniref:hypothetical protein n=2 Tax=Brevibacillus TaxID=55080 RepID=UPI00117FBF63|nr:hypothetical protein [Brevibacillus sp. LEMMJ03]TRY27633.1 hypothetical protein FOI68_04540 [Brevibacillus sp. LEMMJ03]
MSVWRKFPAIAQQVAEAISAAALQIETKIVGDRMTIIAGTGTYDEAHGRHHGHRPRDQAVRPGPVGREKLAAIVSRKKRSSGGQPGLPFWVRVCQQEEQPGEESAPASIT